eukprot:m.18333 g.18333  ORF g.18333 m.18333 type:complete len:50 (-) comp8467_c1_seq4:202-351(-)
MQTSILIGSLITSCRAVQAERSLLMMMSFHLSSSSSSLLSFHLHRSIVG